MGLDELPEGFLGPAPAIRILSRGFSQVAVFSDDMRKLHDQIKKVKCAKPRPRSLQGEIGQ